MDAAGMQEAHAGIREAYWERKDLDEVVRLARAALDAAETATDDVVRGWAKAIAFDLASFTWPGWDEPGIDITPEHLRVGRDAARRNLELATELQRPADKVGIAHWIIGAHHLAAGDRDAARASFSEAERFADMAEDEAGAALARGFEAIAAGDDAGLRLEQATLQGMEDGAGYVEQLDVARRVFG